MTNTNSDYKNIKVLITGGSGFLGINLVRYLRSMGIFDIRTLDIAPFDYPEAGEVDAITGDVRDLEAVRKAMKGVTWVVHAAAALPLYSEHDIITTEVDGCANVLKAAEEKKVSRFIQISSTAVYGVPNHHPIYETDLLVGVGPYGLGKINAEIKCLEARMRGMCITIIRPKSFIGPERLGVFALLYDWARTGHGFPMLGNGKNRYQLLDVDDLDHAIWLALTGPEKAANDTYNIGAKEFATMREDYQSVLDRAGHGKKIRSIPAGFAVSILRILEKLHLSPLYPWVYETASTDSFVSVEKAERLLGYKPRYSNKDALARNYDWYVEYEKDFKGKSGVSHRVPWKQGLLRVAKIFF